MYFQNYVFSSCHIRVSSESTLCNCLNVRELLARNRSDISKLSDRNGTRAHNYLVRKRTLNHSAKIQKICGLTNSFQTLIAFFENQTFSSQAFLSHHFAKHHKILDFQEVFITLSLVLQSSVKNFWT